MRVALFALLLLVTSIPARAIAPSPDLQPEVAHLLDYLEHSSCDFNRNGAWHDAASARKHLQRKYEYLLDKNFIATADEFIHRGATESTKSKLPYMVRCAGKLQPSAQWLSAELARYRASRGAKPAPSAE